MAARTSSSLQKRRKNLRLWQKRKTATMETSRQVRYCSLLSAPVLGVLKDTLSKIGCQNTRLKNLCRQIGFFPLGQVRYCSCLFARVLGEMTIDGWLLKSFSPNLLWCFIYCNKIFKIVGDIVKDKVKGAQVLRIQHLGQVLCRGGSAFMRESDKRTSAFDI